MFYLIAIEPGDENHSWGVMVPDLQGCHSAGENLTECLTNAREAIELHLEGLAEEGQVILAQPDLTINHHENPDYQGCIWGVVEVTVPNQ